MILAQQVTDLINAAIVDQAWPIQTQAERRTFPIRSIDELTETRISVFDGPRSSSLVSRGAWDHGKVIFVAVQRKLDAGDATETTAVDALVDLLERIENLFESLPDGSVSPWEFVQFDESTDRLGYSPALLQSDATYAAVVGLEFLD